MNNIPISVITVCFNDLEGLKKTVSSVARQTYTDIEYIIIDGASTDGTTDFLESHSSTIDYWVSEKDSGIYNAMNKALSHATGTYVTFLNSGDYYCSNDVISKIAIQAAAHDLPSLVYGDAIEYNNTNSKTYLHRSRNIEYLKYGMITNHQAIFYRNNPDIKYSEAFKISSDYEFTIKHYLANRSHLKLDIPIVNFLAEGISQTDNRTRILELLSIQNKYFSTSSLVRFLLFIKFTLASSLKSFFKPIYYLIR